MKRAMLSGMTLLVLCFCAQAAETFTTLEEVKELRKDNEELRRRVLLLETRVKALERWRKQEAWESADRAEENGPEAVATIWARENVSPRGAIVKDKFAFEASALGCALRVEKIVVERQVESEQEVKR